MRNAFLGLALVLAVGSLSASEWKFDPTHTEVSFVATHLKFTKVRGQFKDFDGKVSLNDKDITKSNVSLTVKVASVQTGAPKRDGHLQTTDFFDAEKYPNITFKSTKIEKSGDGYKLTGDLTIRDVTKPVTLDAQISDPLKTDWGSTVRSFSLSGSINRFDYNVAWGKKTGGSLVVGETVILDIQGELDQK